MLKSIGSFSIIQQVIAQVKKNGRPESVTDVLNNRSLANIVAVSVLIIDSQGKIGIIQRTNKVAISSGNFSTTCAGTVSGVDFTADNPFLSCAQREIKEELNLDFDELHFDGIVVPKQKMQPIFLYHAHLNQSWEELFPQIQQARDIAFETQAFYAVPIHQAISFASHNRMTDTAAYQIWQFARLNGYETGWMRSLLSRINNEEYLLPWRKCCDNDQKTTEVE